MEHDDRRAHHLHVVDDHGCWLAHLSVPGHQQLRDLRGGVRQSSLDRGDQPDPHTDADADTDSHADPEADSHADAQTDAQTDPQADTEAHAHANPEADPQTDTEAHTRTDRGCDKGTDPHREADGSAEAHRCACCGTVGDSRSDRHSDGHG
jgi:hypothetical protein